MAANECRAQDLDGYRIVTVAGEVDLSWSTDIRRAVLDGLEARRSVLVDLSAVTYIDSSGVASFVEGYQQARRDRLQFGLVAVSAPVMAVLKLARLDRVFPIHADVTAARTAAPTARTLA